MDTVDLELLSIHLEDAEELHSQFPESFQIPPRVERDGLVPGDLAKLLFTYSSNAEEFTERMWVIVDSAKGSGKFIGILDNEPFEIPVLEAGTFVSFKAEHVCSIDKESSVPTPRSFLQKVLALFTGNRAGD